MIGSEKVKHHSVIVIEWRLTYISDSFKAFRDYFFWSRATGAVPRR